MYMKYCPEKKEIVIGKEVNNLDHFVIDFVKILEKYSDYVIISGYVSILLGRTRATEDVDLFLKKIFIEEFEKLYTDLKDNNFWCLNGKGLEEIYSYLKDGLAIRFARKDQIAPNMEIKFPKGLAEETFDDFVIVKLPSFNLKISSLERQIAFKRYFLKAPKDMEDALHIEEIFKEKLDYSKINKVKELIENDGIHETRKN